MRIRHLALLALAVGAAVFLVQAAANPGGPPPLLDDGTINVAAGEDGRGAWVPYTLTVRNLGSQDFTGRLLMLKTAAPVTARAVRVSIPGLGSLPAPITPGGQAAPPDAGYQFPVALSGRHKQTFNFYAPDDFIGVVVQDALGRQVAEGEVDDRRSVAVGALGDSQTLAGDLQAIRIGDYTARVTQWDAGIPFPVDAVYLSGYTTVILDRYDSGRLTRPQLASLKEFVGLGGELVLAGAADLSRTVRTLPPELVPFAPTSGTVLESLAPVADLAGLDSGVTVPVALGRAASAATVILDAPDGQPLEVESRYGAGRVVELLFDPDTTATGAGAGTVDALATVAFTQAVARGLESLPGAEPGGTTLLDAGALPEVLFPRPTDAPLPPAWLVGGLLGLYLFLAVPMNYLLFSRLGRPTLFWVTAPALAVLFSLAALVIGQVLQAGIRDREIQFYRVGPDGMASRVDVHGLVFPTNGSQVLTFGSDPLLAPMTVTFPDLTPSCSRCVFPAGAGSAGIEEHVVASGSPTIVERGLVYGTVRVVGSASTGSGSLQLIAHLTAVDDRIQGTIANTGKVPISGLLIYTFYNGGYRAALVAQGLAAGSEVQVDQLPQPIGDAAPQLPPGASLSDSQEISLVADETGRRTLTHTGQVAIVGFVKPAASGLAVNGLQPGGTVMATFGMPVELEAASGRLGEVAEPRLAGFYPNQATGLLLDAYDIALPQAAGPLVLRYDQRIYSALEVYDWQARTWRRGGFSQDPASPIVQLTQLDPAEVHDGLVRIRAQEANLSWGSGLDVRFPGEAPAP
jgi:hypothetical protein